MSGLGYWIRYSPWFLTLSLSFFPRPLSPSQLRTPPAQWVECALEGLVHPPILHPPIHAFHNAIDHLFGARVYMEPRDSGKQNKTKHRDTITALQGHG